MERKEALQCIVTKLNERIPKHVIYNELLSKVPYKNDLLLYISDIPDADTSSALKTQNRILIGLLVFLFVLNILDIIAILMAAKSENTPWFILVGWIYILVPLLLVFTIKDIKNFRRNGYRSVINITLMVIGVHLMGHSPLLNGIIIIGPWLLASFMTYKIMKKTHPYDRIFKPIEPIDLKRLEADLIREGMT